jgi:hypothetical protein
MNTTTTPDDVHVANLSAATGSARAASDGPAAAPADAERQRMRFVLFAMALVVGSNVTGAIWHLGPRFALASTMFTFLVMVAWTAWRRDPVLARCLVLGFFAGWLEIITDAWLVAKTLSLVYPREELMVWESPLYMPIAWALVLSQITVVAGWLGQRMSLGKATLLCATLGGSMIPLYEHLAKHAGYWWYVDTPMIFSAPWYIIVAEFLLTLPLVWMYAFAVKRAWPVSVVLGVAAGLWMIPSVKIGWWLTGPCQGAVIQFSCN